MSCGLSATLSRPLVSANTCFQVKQEDAVLSDDALVTEEREHTAWGADDGSGSGFCEEHLGFTPGRGSPGSPGYPVCEEETEPSHWKPGEGCLPVSRRSV